MGFGHIDSNNTVKYSLKQHSYVYFIHHRFHEISSNSKIIRKGKFYLEGAGEFFQHQINERNIDLELSIPMAQITVINC